MPWYRLWGPEGKHKVIIGGKKAKVVHEFVQKAQPCQGK